MRPISILTAPPAPRDEPALPRRRRGTARNLRVLAGAAAAVAALAILFAAPSPGAAIHSDLAVAADALRALPQAATQARVDEAVEAAFHGRAVSVDASGFPVAVAVTVRGLDRKSCIEAESAVRRLEGAVVVELQGYGSPDDCTAKNDMTWRLMP